MNSIKVKSPTGVVHCATLSYKIPGDKGDMYNVLCGSMDYFRTDGDDHKWPRTDEPVTCKRCIKVKLLAELKNTDVKFRTRIIHHDINKGVEFRYGCPEKDLLRTLISQGYIDKIPKRGEQIEITIY